MTDNILINCDGAAFSYNGKTAVKNVSFKISTGDYLCILGENGTGKSTIVKGILGLIKPDCGLVEYKNIKHNEIGYLPQTTSVAANFPVSVYEVVLQGRCEKLGKKLFFTKADKEAAKKNMALLGIDSIASKSFVSLSGGQKQRVLLARALCASDRMLLLDEPVSGLDPIVTSEMYSIIEKLNKEKSLAVVMVSHDTETAAKYASHILHINKEPLFYGLTDEYLKTELSHKFLGGCGHEHH